MTRLYTRDYQRMYDLVMTAMTDLAAEIPIWQRVCANLSDSLHTSFAGEFEIDWPGGFPRRLNVWPQWAADISMTPAQISVHPLVHHLGTHRDPVPRTFDDVADVHGWCHADQYADQRALFREATRQLVIPLGAGDDTVRFVGLGRPGRNFGPRELEYARRVQPAVVALARHSVTLTRWRAAAPADLDREQRARDLGLTPREVGVLVLLADGLSEREIGRRLAISPRTVAKHQEKLHRKLGTTDRLGTVLSAQRLGLVSPPARPVSSGPEPRSRPPAAAPASRPAAR
jgi:DNA-binding CsgD family transcriptional regulator